MMNSQPLIPFESPFPSPKKLNLEKITKIQNDPFDYQKEVMQSLTNYFCGPEHPDTTTLGYQPGLVIMPTGSGKTLTTVTWLLKQMVKNGYKVLWLTHRGLLLDQAAYTTCNHARLAWNPKLNQNTLHYRIISGMHNGMSTGSFKESNIIFGSIQTLSRHIDNFDFFLKGIDKNKLVVVIDEAHHTPMPSYRKVLKKIKSIVPGFKLLGLTATPKRLVLDEEKYLNTIFNSTYVVNIPLSDLISKGILATPKYKRITTNIQFDSSFQSDDVDHLKKFGTISQKIQTEIAECKPRNLIITEEYLKNKDKYGKTLIFAVNQIHCATLCEELLKQAEKLQIPIRCDYAVSGDTARGIEAIDKFKRNELDVLVNVMILTEGADIPDIKTIFLTRPTESHSLMMQMIGRALRGPAVGGKSEAYIVDFHDGWGIFDYWLSNPEFILEKGDEPVPPIPPGYGPVTYTPWDAIIELYRTIDLAVINIDQNFMDNIPVGWYSISSDEEDMFDRRIFVFENQKQGFEDMEKDVEWLCEKKVTDSDAFGKFFGDCNDPLPHDIPKILSYIKENKEMPPFFSFEERDQLDPEIIAHEIKNNNLTQVAEEELIDKLWETKPILIQVYRDIERFLEAISQAKIKIKRDKKITNAEKGERIPVFIEPNREIVDYLMGESHNLSQLYDRVLNQWFNNNRTLCSEIRWTNKPIKSAWGYYRRKDRKIFMNCILKSKKVPENVVEFIIYHEMLHAKGNLRHDQTFRSIEHKFPDWPECNHFLDTFAEKYSLPEFTGISL